MLASALVPATAGARDAAAPVTTAEVRHKGGAAVVVLRAVDLRDGVRRTQYRLDGGSWVDYAARSVPILDRTEASFRRWRAVGDATFRRNPDGSVGSDPVGLGMLWYPQQSLRDVALTLQVRDARRDGTRSNGGVFVRFPDPERAVPPAGTPLLACQQGPALLRPEWVAISCGHEIQVNDGTADPQATGSVYNFRPLPLGRARPVPQGRWSSLEIRLQGRGDYTVHVLRDGRLINSFRNTRGQAAARPGDPPTDARQFSEGFVGLQAHARGDLLDYRDVAVRSLDPEDAAVTVAAPGRHVLEYRSVDFAGNVEKTRRTTFRV